MNANSEHSSERGACDWCRQDGCTPENSADCPCPHHGERGTSTEGEQMQDAVRQTEVGTPREHASLVVGKEAAMRPVTQYVEAFYWTCQDCGWLGTGLFSMNAAMAEAGRHYEDTHAIEGMTAPPIVERRDQEKSSG